MRATGNEAGEMRHVDHEIGADFVGDLAEALEIPHARISGAAGDDQLRLLAARLLGNLVHVEHLIVTRTP
jgi:hypothetical protein